MTEERAPRLRGWASPFVYPTALFIRDYLLSHGEGYAQEIWRELKKARGGRHVCTYDSFKRNYIYILKKLGLIEPSRTEEVPGARAREPVEEEPLEEPAKEESIEERSAKKKPWWKFW